MNKPPLSPGNRRYDWRRNKLPGLALRSRLTAALDAQYPPAADLLAFQPVAPDQGQEGACTAHSETGARAELANVLGVGPQSIGLNGPFSRQFVYAMERTDDGDLSQDAGSSIAESVVVAEKYGAPLESDYPYTPEDEYTEPPDEIKALALPFRVTGSQTVNPDLNSFKAAIAQKRSVLIGFTVFESFESPEVAATGIWPMPSQNEQVLGGHAVRVIGYDDNMVIKGNSFLGSLGFGETRGAVLVRNSWGEWGLNGNFWMPYQFLFGGSCSDFHILGTPLPSP